MLFAVRERGPGAAISGASPHGSSCRLVPEACRYLRALSCAKTAGAARPKFVVDDRPGAGSIIGTEIVAKSPPDGYTLLLMSNTHTVNESLVPKKPFALMKDFVADRADQLFGPGAGRASVGAGEIDQGADRARKGQAERP